MKQIIKEVVQTFFGIFGNIRKLLEKFPNRKYIKLYPFLFSIIILGLLYINFINNLHQYNWLLIPLLLLSIIIYFVAGNICEEIDDSEHECSIYRGIND